MIYGMDLHIMKAGELIYQDYGIIPGLMNNNHFPILIMIGRPASGKSEIIEYLKHIPKPERAERFRVADMDVLDDFPILWSWFEEDDILSKQFELPRLHSDERYYFKYDYLWHVLIKKLGLEYEKRLVSGNHYHDGTTTIVEFSRGTEHGGYTEAFKHLPVQLLHRASIVYINVSFEESLRKNRLRFNPDEPGSILEHSLPDEKIETLYRHDDWTELSSSGDKYIDLKSFRVPYVVFENEDDVTTGSPDHLGDRLETDLNLLWNYYLDR